MGDEDQTLPFELKRAADGTWHGRWDAAQVHVAVAGTTDAPVPALLATLRGLVEHWREVREASARFARELAPEALVSLTPVRLGGFAAGTCGFDRELVFGSLAVMEEGRPSCARVTFCTGLPDGYVTFELVLEDGQPTALSAFAS